MRANFVNFALSSVGGNSHANNGVQNGRLENPAGRRLSLVSALCTCLIGALLLTTPRLAFSVGVGAAEVRSNLGQPLQVSIPIFNVTNPDSLVLSVSTDMFNADPSKRLSASLDRSNGQLAVRVFTPWPVMEPYVQFDLELQDGAVRQSKGFILLLEFRPSSGRADPLRLNNSDVATPKAQPTISVEPSSSVVARPSGARAAAAAETIMGPYDWAEQGQVAGSFGAVLDGQSLWRVARRINRAMGVSVEQMMLALYEANPDAFYTDSISSLKAGSYLTIPDQQTVQRVSAGAAKQRVADLSSPSERSNLISDAPVEEPDQAAETRSPSSTPEVLEVQEPPAIEQETVADTVETPTQPLFVIGDSNDIAAANTGAAESSNTATAVSDDSQQVVIDSLSKTIGDLMQDNVDKEQRLQAMDERLRALETTLDNVGLQDTATNATLPTTGDEKTAWWLWLLPILAGIGAWLGLRARRDMSSPEDELFTPKAEDEVEPHSVHVIGDEPESQGFEEYYSDTDFSVMRSQRSQKSEDHHDEGEVEGVTYHEFEDDYVPEKSRKVDEHTIEFDTSNVAAFPREPKRNLDEAVDKFIEERDFTAARDALDAARGKELDEPNYHFQRLRILLEKSDEHGFYEYFNLVEAKFDDVDRDLKMDLANLVSRLNQQG